MLGGGDHCSAGGGRDQEPREGRVGVEVAGGEGPGACGEGGGGEGAQDGGYGWELGAGFWFEELGELGEGVYGCVGVGEVGEGPRDGLDEGGEAGGGGGDVAAGANEGGGGVVGGRPDEGVACGRGW